MLNVIKSIIVTFITVIVSILSYLKGPILVGLIVGATIMAFAGEASAATAQPTFVALSFSETFAIGVIALAIMGAIILFVKESN